MLSETIWPLSRIGERSNYFSKHQPRRARTRSKVNSAKTKVAETGVPERLNATIAASELVMIGVCFHTVARVQTAWAVLVLALVFGALMNSVYSIIHEAEHGMLFRNRRLNDVVGSFMALFFPAPFHLIRQGHLGHHLRNRSDDEAFDFYFEEDHKIWKILVWYGILTGFYWVMVVLSNVVFLFFPFTADKKYWRVDQASAPFMHSLNASYAVGIQLERAGARGWY